MEENIGQGIIALAGLIFLLCVVAAIAYENTRANKQDKKDVDRA